MRMNEDMSLTEAKMRVLEVLWKEDRPMKSNEVAQELGFRTPATTMHLLGLRGSGHVVTTKQGHYSITDVGKEAMGFPRIDRAQASKILSPLTAEKGFHFYTGLNKYLGIYANGLADFCDKIQKIDVKSIEFHVPRRDFENWFKGLGDEELAKRMNTIRGMNLSGEDLRKKIYGTARHRDQQLRSL